MARKYTEQDKLNALNLIKEGASITDAGLELNIPRTTVSTWYRAHQSSVVTQQKDSSPSEIQVLRAEVQSLRNTVAEQQINLELQKLKSRIADLEKFIESKEELFLWAAKKIRSEAKRNDESDSGWTPPGK
jgi:transposase-like protein